MAYFTILKSLQIKDHRYYEIFVVIKISFQKKILKLFFVLFASRINRNLLIK